MLDIEAEKLYQADWYQKNKKKKDEQNKKWRKLNPERNKEISRLSYLRMLKNEPWKSHWKGAEQRCNNPNRTGYSYYGGKGIKFLLTLDEIKKLWFRDNANKMKRPSIDRKDSSKDYIYDNCQFIELLKNQTKYKHVRNSKGQFTRR